eukprot:PhM_4_TR2471/c1_g1_i1/m.61975
MSSSEALLLEKPKTASNAAAPKTLDKDFRNLLIQHLTKFVLTLIYCVGFVILLSVLSYTIQDNEATVATGMPLTIEAINCDVKVFNSLSPELLQQGLSPASVYAHLDMTHSSNDKQSISPETGTFHLRGGDRAVPCVARFYIPNVVMYNITLSIRGALLSIDELVFDPTAYFVVRHSNVVSDLEPFVFDAVDARFGFIDGLDVSLTKGMIRVDVPPQLGPTLRPASLATGYGDVMISSPMHSVVAKFTVSNEGYCLSAPNQTTEVSCVHSATATNSSNANVQCHGTAFLCTRPSCPNLIRTNIKATNVYATIAGEASQHQAGKKFNGTVDFDSISRAELGYTPKWASLSKGLPNLQTINIRGEESEDGFFVQTDTPVALELGEATLSLLTLSLLSSHSRRLNVRLDPNMCPWNPNIVGSDVENLERKIVTLIENYVDPSDTSTLTNNLVAAQRGTSGDGEHRYFTYRLDGSEYRRMEIVLSPSLQSAIIISCIVALLCTVGFIVALISFGPMFLETILRTQEARLKIRAYQFKNPNAAKVVVKDKTSFKELVADRGLPAAIRYVLRTKLRSTFYYVSAMIAWVYRNKFENSLTAFIEENYEKTTSRDARISMTNFRNAYLAYTNRTSRRVMTIHTHLHILRRHGANVEKFSDATTDCFVGIRVKPVDGSVAPPSLPPLSDDVNSLSNFVEAQMEVTGRDVDYVSITDFALMYTAFCRERALSRIEITENALSARGVKLVRLELEFVTGLKHKPQSHMSNMTLLSECVVFEPVSIPELSVQSFYMTFAEIFFQCIVLDLASVIFIVMVLVYEWERAKLTSRREFQNALTSDHINYTDVLRNDLFLRNEAKMTTLSEAVLNAALVMLFLGRIELIAFHINGFLPFLKHLKLVRGSAAASTSSNPSGRVRTSSMPIRIWNNVRAFIRFVYVLVLAVYTLFVLMYLFLACCWIILGTVINPNVMMVYTGTLAAIVGTAMTLWRGLSSVYEDGKEKLEQEIARQLLSLVESCPMLNGAAASSDGQFTDAAKLGLASQTLVAKKSPIPLSLIQSLSKGTTQEGIEELAKQLDIPPCVIALVMAATRRTPEDAQLALKQCLSYVEVPGEVIDIAMEVVMAVSGSGGKSQTRIRVNSYVVLNALFALRGEFLRHTLTHEGKPIEEIENALVLNREVSTKVQTLVKAAMPPLTAVMNHRFPDEAALQGFIMALVSEIVDIIPGGRNKEMTNLINGTIPKLFSLVKAAAAHDTRKTMLNAVELVETIVSYEGDLTVDGVNIVPLIVSAVKAYTNNSPLDVVGCFSQPFFKRALNEDDWNDFISVADDGQEVPATMLFLLGTCFLSNKSIKTTISKSTVISVVRFLLYKDDEAIKDLPESMGLTSGTKSRIFGFRRLLTFQSSPRGFAMMFGFRRFSDQAGTLLWAILYSDLLLVAQQLASSTTTVDARGGGGDTNLVADFLKSMRELGTDVTRRLVSQIVDVNFFRRNLSAVCRTLLGVESDMQMINILESTRSNDGSEDHIRAIYDIVYQETEHPASELMNLYQDELTSNGISPAVISALSDVTQITFLKGLARYALTATYLLDDNVKKLRNFTALDRRLDRALATLAPLLKFDSSVENTTTICVQLVNAFTGDISGLLTDSACNSTNNKLLGTFDDQIRFSYLVSGVKTGQQQVMQYIKQHAPKGPARDAFVALLLQLFSLQGSKPSQFVRSLVTSTAVGSLMPKTLSDIVEQDDVKFDVETVSHVILDLVRYCCQPESLVDGHVAVLCEVLFLNKPGRAVDLLHRLNKNGDSGVVAQQLTDVDVNNEYQLKAYLEWTSLIEEYESTIPAFRATRALLNIITHRPEVTASEGEDLFELFLQQLPANSLIRRRPTVQSGLRSVFVTIWDDIVIPYVNHVLGANDPSAIPFRSAHQGVEIDQAEISSKVMNTLILLATGRTGEWARTFYEFVLNHQFPVSTEFLPTDVMQQADKLEAVIQVCKSNCGDDVLVPLLSVFGPDADELETIVDLLNSTKKYALPANGVHNITTVNMYLELIDLEDESLDNETEKLLGLFYEHKSTSDILRDRLDSMLRMDFMGTDAFKGLKAHEVAFVYTARAIVEESPIASYLSLWLGAWQPAASASFTAHVRSFRQMKMHEMVLSLDQKKALFNKENEWNIYTLRAWMYIADEYAKAEKKITSELPQFKGTAFGIADLVLATLGSKISSLLTQPAILAFRKALLIPAAFDMDTIDVTGGSGSALENATLKAFAFKDMRPLVMLYLKQLSTAANEEDHKKTTRRLVLLSVCLGIQDGILYDRVGRARQALTDLQNQDEDIEANSSSSDEDDEAGLDMHFEITANTGQITSYIELKKVPYSVVQELIALSTRRPSTFNAIGKALGLNPMLVQGFVYMMTGKPSGQTLSGDIAALKELLLPNEPIPDVVLDLILKAVNGDFDALMSAAVKIVRDAIGEENLFEGVNPGAYAAFMHLSSLALALHPKSKVPADVFTVLTLCDPLSRTAMSSQTTAQTYQSPFWIVGALSACVRGNAATCLPMLSQVRTHPILDEVLQRVTTFGDVKELVVNITSLSASDLLKKIRSVPRAEVVAFLGKMLDHFGVEHLKYYAESDDDDDDNDNNDDEENEEDDEEEEEE